MMFVLFQRIYWISTMCFECGPRGYKSDGGPFPISEGLSQGCAIPEACTYPRKLKMPHVGWDERWPWLEPGKQSCFWTMSHVCPLLLALVGQSHMEFPEFTHLATCHSLSAWELPVPAVTLQMCLAKIPSLGKEAHCILEQEWIYFPRRGL